ncbi:uncharacterized protein LDX57_012708 [Aspergillus melleus]|uniref:uncharacterized protein n=1 Tax=Aspergillus melleus TaxID=138277 RepID=UPI001E8E14F4|nr:uncharacterized protein LDX57_012708 [Aspergillus melleus]KAH8435079.1 hypothetical protein LDX57_012708 [Aspergillus melleus]
MVATRNLTTTLVATSTASYQEPRPESTFWRFSGPLPRHGGKRQPRQGNDAGRSRPPAPPHRGLALTVPSREMKPKLENWRSEI